MDGNVVFTAFSFIAIIFSVVAHEVSHGYMAERLGDPTARLMGRLTLNPIKHIDLVGSILLPLFLSFTGGIVFGWAKPVPYNPRNIKNKNGASLVAFAGPLTNLSIALVFALLYHFLGSLIPNSLAPVLFARIVLINISLAIFNLVPIPPLDGAKVLMLFIPYEARQFRNFLEQGSQLGFIALLVFIFFGFQLISPIISTLYRFLIGG
jgi:Zn-dependent protease